MNYYDVQQQDEDGFYPLPPRFMWQSLYPTGCGVVVYSTLSNATTFLDGTEELPPLVSGIVTQVGIDFATSSRENCYLVCLSNDNDDKEIVCLPEDELRFAPSTWIWITLAGYDDPLKGVILGMEPESDDSYMVLITPNEEEGEEGQQPHGVYSNVSSSQLLFRPRDLHGPLDESELLKIQTLSTASSSHDSQDHPWETTAPAPAPAPAPAMEPEGRNLTLNPSISSFPSVLQRRRQMLENYRSKKIALGSSRIMDNQEDLESMESVLRRLNSVYSESVMDSIRSDLQSASVMSDWEAKKDDIGKEVMKEDEENSDHYGLDGKEGSRSRSLLSGWEAGDDESVQEEEEESLRCYWQGVDSKSRQKQLNSSNRGEGESYASGQTSIFDDPTLEDYTAGYTLNTCSRTENGASILDDPTMTSIFDDPTVADLLSNFEPEDTTRSIQTPTKAIEDENRSYGEAFFKDDNTVDTMPISEGSIYSINNNHTNHDSTNDHHNIEVDPIQGVGDGEGHDTIEKLRNRLEHLFANGNEIVSDVKEKFKTSIPEEFWEQANEVEWGWEFYGPRKQQRSNIADQLQGELLERECKREDCVDTHAGMKKKSLFDQNFQDDEISNFNIVNKPSKSRPWANIEVILNDDDSNGNEAGDHVTEVSSWRIQDSSKSFATNTTSVYNGDDEETTTTEKCRRSVKRLPLTKLLDIMDMHRAHFGDDVHADRVRRGCENLLKRSGLYEF